MLNTRILPRLDVADGRVVKGVNFVEPEDAARAHVATGMHRKNAPGRALAVILRLHVPSMRNAVRQVAVATLAVVKPAP
jgi:hypothetical protein